LREEDAVVCIRPVTRFQGLTVASHCVQPGDRLPKDHEVVEANPSAFAEIVPVGLERRDALVAKQNIPSPMARKKPR
jgi:hypothetical protein